MGNYSAPTAGTFTISYLFAEAGQRCGYSINIGFCRNHTHRHTHTHTQTYTGTRTYMKNLLCMSAVCLLAKHEAKCVDGLRGRKDTRGHRATIDREAHKKQIVRMSK